MMDVCCEVLSIYEGSYYFKYKIRWINLGFVESFYIFPTTTYIRIKKDKLTEEWLYFNPNSAGTETCYRRLNWKRIVLNKAS